MNPADQCHGGGCFCGRVRFEVSGRPAVTGYCHCEDCQKWSASPVNAFSLWPAAQVRITAGESELAVFNKTESSYRKFCRICGGHVMTDHPGMGLVDVYASLIEGFDHQPAMHVHYGRRMLAVRDGLPKFKDLPADFGGSGETLPD